MSFLEGEDKRVEQNKGHGKLELEQQRDRILEQQTQNKAKQGRAR
jgi:hypothetical protein